MRHRLLFCLVLAAIAAAVLVAVRGSQVATCGRLESLGKGVPFASFSRRRFLSSLNKADNMGRIDISYPWVHSRQALAATLFPQYQ